MVNGGEMLVNRNDTSAEITSSTIMIQDELYSTNANGEVSLRIPLESSQSTLLTLVGAPLTRNHPRCSVLNQGLHEYRN